MRHSATLERARKSGFDFLAQHGFRIPKRRKGHQNSINVSLKFLNVFGLPARNRKLFRCRMFSIQQLLGKKNEFFDLLEASAREACASAGALKVLSRNLQQPNALDDFAVSRRKEKAVTAEISEALCITFITALEREDIEALSTALYKIPKTIEKIGERILLAPHFLQGVDLSAQIDMLERATATVLTMIQEVRADAEVERVRAINDRLQHIEGQADKLVLTLLKELYASQIQEVRIVFLKDLYELLEKVTDRCRDAGNILIQIVLKNS